MSSFLLAKSDNEIRESLIYSLSFGITKAEEFIETINYVIDQKSELFDNKNFHGSLFDGDDQTLDLILPSIRRVWGKVYETPPPILRDKQLELFQLSFDIDHFIDYLVKFVPKVKLSLQDFEYLDRAVETLTLIVDNYIAMLIKNLTTDDITLRIRDFKLKKLTR